MTAKYLSGFDKRVPTQVANGHNARLACSVFRCLLSLLLFLAATFGTSTVRAQAPVADPVAQAFGDTFKPEPRQWTDSTGNFSVEATLSRLVNGAVALVTTDGRTLSVPLGRLSEADKRYVDSVAIKTIAGKVVGLADGDTITVLHARTQYKIRLEGIDAPEKGQDYGTQARKALADKVFQKDVLVLWQTEDKYDRVLGHVFVGNQWINKELVQEGWAWHYKKYSKSRVLAEAEVFARTHRYGLWQDPAPVAPWDHRNQPKTAAVPEPSPQPARQTRQGFMGTEDPIVYVTKSGKKYHMPGCRHLGKSAIPIRLSEAKRRYTPCTVCGAAGAGR